MYGAVQQALRSAPGQGHAIGGQPLLEVVAVPGQAVDGADRGLHRTLAGLGGEQAVSDRGQKLVDVGQLDAGARLHDEIEVVVLGVPRLWPRRVSADVEVVVLVELMARVEMEHRHTQVQRRQKP